MTREHAKELLPIIQAFAEGKTVEYLNNEKKWKESDNLSFWLKPQDYRIKFEPKYRPFKSRDECWNEMLKHQPIGWVQSNCSDVKYYIISISDQGIFCCEKTHFNNAFYIYKFADGTPFGIKEE